MSVPLPNYPLLILEGRFLTIGPPGKSVVWIFYVDYSVFSLSHICIYLSILYIECTWNTMMCICLCSVTQLCVTLCDPMYYSPPASSVHGIFQARILEWVTISSSKVSSRFRDRISVSCVCYIAGRSLTTEPSGKPCITMALIYLYSLWYVIFAVCPPTSSVSSVL